MHRISTMSLIIAQYFNFIVHVCMCMHGTITLFKRYTFIRNFWQLIWRFLDQGVSSFDAMNSELLSYLKITKHIVRCSINNESGRSCNQEFFRSIGCAMNTWLKYLQRLVFLNIYTVPFTDQNRLNQTYLYFSYRIEKIVFKQRLIKTKRQYNN